MYAYTNFSEPCNMHRCCSFIIRLPSLCSTFFFNDTAPTEIYTLSLHDALPICDKTRVEIDQHIKNFRAQTAEIPLLIGGKEIRTGNFINAIEPHAHSRVLAKVHQAGERSEEHTSELQSLRHLVCRLLLEKKKKT